MSRIMLSLALLLAASIALGACSLVGGEKVVKIGAAVSETGRYSQEGKHIRQGYLLWEEWVNEEQGGIQVGDDKYQVELVMYDDEGDPSKTASLVEKLIDEDEV